MEGKDFDLNVFFVNGNVKSYKFVLDYGTSDLVYCDIDENNNVFISFKEDVYDKSVAEKIKNDILECFFSEIFGKEASKIIEAFYSENVPSAFENAEKFIIDNDIFAEKEEKLIEDESFDGFKEDNNGYTSMCIYDEGLGTVDFYIKSKLYDDEMGIKINSDGSFYPIISTKHINLIDEAKEKRKEIIKAFIYETLTIKINFGTIDGIRTLRIPKLYERAQSYAKKNGIVNYTDEKGDLYNYQNFVDGNSLNKCNDVKKV